MIYLQIKIMKKQINIELTEKGLAEILAEHFKVTKEGANISVYKDDGDGRGPTHTTITFTAPIE